ncbi:isoprenylcysteine carboxylmethyltransferase family protein [Mesorhizobium sp. CU2]|uniref:methyltransferase family protein n=1 Tax=unclassified Mesorhizobium TaxID=325217 RepID=UPI00112DF009|nr:MULTISPECIES: isoprenylcysteine carboxylmethyltransferase family protein [unclassified Mesorhizobium]TPN89350.1 isoprenylcysteine carboxylmethyltransferase family protein [Mesorhizobium sp. CU3]TPO07487.1 isoprenylcysteine carboxylmethyltransferase family protein [Mesorhizobium sp. CU2]
MLTEDFIGRILIVVVTTVLAVLSFIALLFHFNGETPASILAFTTKIFSVTLLLLQIIMTTARLPPKGTAAGVKPRIISVAGSFMMLVAMFLTEPVDSELLQVVALCLILVGTASSIFCLFWLGRSFSIMATARRLVTTGPYSIVRHPLYVCEAVFVLGMIVSHFSAIMLALGIIQFLLQFRRARYEELILRQTFPEYEEYAKRVPMLVPWLAPAPALSSDTEV